ncbi:ArsR/SmtB family transcription factor [Devosia pacifica]|uniref:ArsR/SmtB family transcription factor n=1 Tax=Devosia pacifica TaxID=1335967 RepID=UPI0016734868|nr:metalloregulator ArsR/SmtB family transcription factor [Devosia pacifica]
MALAATFRLLGDPTRLRILLHCGNGRVAVGGLAAELKLDPSLVSQHLRLLRAGRIVSGRRSGKHVFYQLNDKHVERALGVMIEHADEIAAGRSARLKQAP